MNKILCTLCHTHKSVTEFYQKGTVCAKCRGVRKCSCKKCLQAVYPHSEFVLTEDAITK